MMRDTRRQAAVGPRSPLHGVMRDPWGTCVRPQCQVKPTSKGVLGSKQSKAGLHPLWASPYLEDQTKRLVALQPKQRATKVHSPPRARLLMNSPYEPQRSPDWRAMRTLHDRMQVNCGSAPTLEASDIIAQESSMPSQFSRCSGV
jgi:hypothetical protein